MALSHFIHCLPVRIVLVLAHVYFIGFFSAGSRVVTSLLTSTPARLCHRHNASARAVTQWTWSPACPPAPPYELASTDLPTSEQLPSASGHASDPLNGRNSLALAAPMLALNELSGPLGSGAPAAAPPLASFSGTDCDFLDAQLTGLRCHQPIDLLTRQQCELLSTCNPLQPTQADIEQRFPENPPACHKEFIGPSGARVRYVWRCPLLWGPPKFFHEARASAHLDARWGRQPLTPSQKQPVMTALFTAWSAFTRERGLVSWLFAGSLIGWYFNKEMLPWDDDFDVQVLASHLLGQNHYLQYNQTVYQGRYFFEINPYSANRNSDPKNLIDARFIDRATGVFIDIVAISYFPDVGLLRCKQREGFVPAHLFPLRRTTFMGVEAWVPHDVPQALRRKYGPRVFLPQQPQPHHTTHCPTPAPCAKYSFHAPTSRWVSRHTGYAT